MELDAYDHERGRGSFGNLYDMNPVICKRLAIVSLAKKLPNKQNEYPEKNKKVAAMVVPFEDVDNDDKEVDGDGTP